MSKILTLLLTSLLFSICLHAQDIPVNDSGQVEYLEVVEIANTSKADLYSRAQRWFVDFYNSGKSVVQLADAERQTVIGNGLMTYPITVKGGYVGEMKVKYQLEIACKDNKYRISIRYFQYDTELGLVPAENWLVDDTYFEMTKGQKKKQQQQSDDMRAQHIAGFAKELKHIINSIKKALAKGDDW